MVFGLGDDNVTNESKYSSSHEEVHSSKDDPGSSLQERIAGAAASFAMKKFQEGVEDQKGKVSMIEKLAGLAVSEVEKLAGPESMSHEDKERAKEAARRKTQHMYESKYPPDNSSGGRDNHRRQDGYVGLPTTHNNTSAGGGGYADVKHEEGKQSAYGGIVSNYMKTPSSAAAGGGYSKVDNTSGQGDFWRTDGQGSRPTGGRSDQGYDGGRHGSGKPDQGYDGRRSDQGVYGSSDQGIGSGGRADQGSEGGRSSHQGLGGGRSDHSYCSGDRSDHQGYGAAGGRSDEGYGSSGRTGGGRGDYGDGDLGRYDSGRRRSDDDQYRADSRY